MPNVYPCVKDVHCELVAPDSFSLTGNIVLSCVFVFLVILLVISLKVCHMVADRNDRKKVGYHLPTILYQLLITSYI